MLILTMLSQKTSGGHELKRTEGYLFEKRMVFNTAKYIPSRWSIKNHLCSITAKDPINIAPVVILIQIFDPGADRGRPVIHPVGIRSCEIHKPVAKKHFCPFSDLGRHLFSDTVNIYLHQNIHFPQSAGRIPINKVTSFRMRQDWIITSLLKLLQAIDGILFFFPGAELSKDKFCLVQCRIYSSL